MGPNKGTVEMLELETVLDIWGYVNVYKFSPNSGYFWKSDLDPAGFGPFPSVEATLKHYAKTIKDRKADVEQQASNVIQVDFRAKKRK